MWSLVPDASRSSRPLLTVTITVYAFLGLQHSVCHWYKMQIPAVQAVYDFCKTLVSYTERAKRPFHSFRALKRIPLYCSFLVPSSFASRCAVVVVVNVTVLANVNSRSRLLYAVARPSVVCPSFVCLSVTFVHPTQPFEIFSNLSTLYGTLAIRWHPWKFFRRSSQGNPSVGGKRKRGSQI